MKTITNKTRGLLVVSLPGGKKLRLGPGKNGQIGAKAEDHPPLKKLIDAGDIEVQDDGDRPVAGHSGGGGGRTSTTSQSSSGLRRTGDR